LSKLFDQLKNAARGREERSPGLLLEALQKAKASSPTGANPPTGDDTPARPGAQAELPLAPDAPATTHPSPTTAVNSYVGIALAAGIFTAVVIAWNAAPWRAPQKIKIDPTELKLDRTLDLQRPSPKGTTSPSSPS
jgi:hypothetical protein